VLFVREAYKHCKALAASGSGRAVAEAAAIDVQDVLTGDNGVDGQLTDAFLAAIARHRDWARESKAESVPA
jgi:catalase